MFLKWNNYAPRTHYKPINVKASNNRNSKHEGKMDKKKQKK